MIRKVVIVGGGFGGVETAFSLLELLGTSVHITLIDQSGKHSFIPSIHRIISGGIRASDIEIPLPALFASTNIQFIHDEVVSIDFSKRLVTTLNLSLDYDYLVLSCGAQGNFYDVTGAQKFAYPFRSSEDAEKIHSDLEKLLSEHGQKCHIIIAGGGTEGVEVAGELLDVLTQTRYKHDFTSGNSTVELIHGQAELLPGFPSQARQLAQKYLTDKGITIITGDRITEVQKNTVILKSGRQRSMSMLVWTGGIQPNPLLQNSSLSKDSKGWLTVTRHLHVPDDIRVFGVGDTVSIYTPKGYLQLPRLAYHALDQALVVSLNIYYHIQGRKLMSYFPKSKPQLVSIGSAMGIMAYGTYVSSGEWVIWAKKLVEKQHLMKYKTAKSVTAITTKLPGTEWFHLFKAFLPI